MSTHDHYVESPLRKFIAETFSNAVGCSSDYHPTSSIELLQILRISYEVFVDAFDRDADDPLGKEVSAYQKDEVEELSINFLAGIEIA